MSGRISLATTMPPRSSRLSRCGTCPLPAGNDCRPRSCLVHRQRVRDETSGGPWGASRAESDSDTGLRSTNSTSHEGAQPSAARVLRGAGGSISRSARPRQAFRNGSRMSRHTLRHTYAAFLIREGAHPKVIQTLMGHTSIKVTLDLYGHLFPGMGEELVERLDRARQTNVLERLFATDVEPPSTS